jgi:septum site-determining protein MinC
METQTKTQNTQLWDIKISPWSFVTLTLATDDISHLAISLQTKLAQAPGFFQHTPIILAFDENCDRIEMGDINQIIEIFQRYQLNILAFYGTMTWVRELAEFFHVPLLTKRTVSEEQKNTHLITEPLRAGQQCFFEGDIIALAPIHSGAEVISKGHIHCYHQAHGRLIAGVNGDKNVKIFSILGQPELISIAGTYITKNQHPDFDKSVEKRCYYGIKNDKLTFDYCI